MRLDRFVSEVTGATRSEAKAMISGGRVTVNSGVVKDCGLAVKEETDCICIDGKQQEFSEFAYFMLNKPAGVVSATRDRADAVVVSLISAEDRKKRALFPVGRLDKDTEGLLIITDDGPLSHRLLSPKKHTDKLYFAKLKREISKEDITLFAQGFRVDEELTAMPAVLRHLSESERKTFLAEGEAGAAVTLAEGKFHEVKRMFAATGNEVLYLKRMAMGKVFLDPALAPGEYRKLTVQEIAALQEGGTGEV